MKAWKRLAEGHYVDLEDLTLDDIAIEDIETSLNYVYRFTGHHKNSPPLTVAQHTLLCMNLAEIFYTGDEKIKHSCLIHDFGEAYYGDIATPLKRVIGKEGMKKITGPVDDLINQKFWMLKYGEHEPDGFVEAATKVCDLMSLDIERRNMWKSQVGKDKWPPVPSNKFSLLDKQQLFEEVAAIKYVKLGDFL